MRNWDIKQLDVENAFLHGDLEEDVYMQQPQGYVDELHPTHGSTLYVLVFVDDIIVTGSHPVEISGLIEDLSVVFALKDLGDLSFFLGIELLRKWKELILTQRKYVTDLLRKTKLDGVKPVNTPLAVNVKIQKQGTKRFHDSTLYRSVVGALQYLHLARPDISVAVNKVCQYMHDPYEENWELVKRIIRYLKNTVNYGLHIRSSSDFSLQAYSDADWAGSLDDRRSTSVYCIYFGGNLISWSARKQKTVSKSSTEAEYRGIAIATSEIKWIQSLLQELGVQISPPILW
ncbi:uncharacterized protein LOC113344595 [Papaver somniferum]|uniref:uncharacterized protein LOC113344595 n=1 Tax=Papaver somniferum TaxID=3469 RepID=UPI000E6FB480|nr:uncharacterized protein LOC113344595 [Papaver somniferum]